MEGLSSYMKHHHIETYKMTCEIENCYICNTNDTRFKKVKTYPIIHRLFNIIVNSTLVNFLNRYIFPYSHYDSYDITFQILGLTIYMNYFVIVV